MSTIHVSRQRMLAACVAAVCAAAAAAAHATVAAPAAAAVSVPHVPNAVVTNCDDDGPGSLRVTVNSAASGDVIDLTQLDSSTISLTTGAIIIQQDELHLVGPARSELTIDGSPTPGQSVLYHSGYGALSVSGMMITGGSKYRANGPATGGCIHSYGSVNLEDVEVIHCSATGYNASALGGGVFARGEVYMLDSTVSYSHTRATGYASGGGVYALGGFISKYSTISHSYGYAATSTPSFGGGVFARGPVFITGTTISDNSAIRMGGIAMADNNGYNSTIVNSTISSNTAYIIGGAFARQQLNLYNSTIAFNHSYSWTDGAGHYFAAGLYITTAGEMDSTIISSNVNFAAPFPTADLTGAGGSGFNGGHNNVMFCGAPCPNDTSHDDPGLGPLQDNGGPTRTHVPTPGVWDTFGGTNVLSVPWDQRGPGFPRQTPPDFPEIGAIQINSDIIFVNGFN